MSTGSVFAFVGLALLCEGRPFYEHPELRARLTQPGGDPEHAISLMLDELEQWAPEAREEQSQ